MTEYIYYSFIFLEEKNSTFEEQNMFNFILYYSMSEKFPVWGSRHFKNILHAVISLKNRVFFKVPELIWFLVSGI